MARADPKGYYMLCSGSAKSQLWFDGYEGENTLLMDEFRPTWCSYSYLLRLLDKWPMRLPMKGAHTWALWNRVIITTTHPVGTWYHASDTATGELTRRITKVIQMREGGDQEEVVPGSKVVGNNGTTTLDPPSRAPPESGFQMTSWQEMQSRFGFGGQREPVPVDDEIAESVLEDLNGQLDFLFE